MTPRPLSGACVKATVPNAWHGLPCHPARLVSVRVQFAVAVGAILGPLALCVQRFLCAHSMLPHARQAQLRMVVWGFFSHAAGHPSFQSSTPSASPQPSTPQPTSFEDALKVQCPTTTAVLHPSCAVSRYVARFGVISSAVSRWLFDGAFGLGTGVLL